MKTCMAWDGGTINGALDSVFGFAAHKVIETKTTKTKCGKTVPTKHIDNSAYTCPECHTIMERERNHAEEIRNLLAQLKGGHR